MAVNILHALLQPEEALPVMQPFCSRCQACKLTANATPNVITVCVADASQPCPAALLCALQYDQVIIAGAVPAPGYALGVLVVFTAAIGLLDGISIGAVYGEAGDWQQHEHGAVRDSNSISLVIWHVSHNLLYIQHCIIQFPAKGTLVGES
jgi:hypothetical protein